jgi:hypothetical protein
LEEAAIANPTLIAQSTPWRGFTFDELEERLLASRGLTNDSTTGRTVATTGEVTAAKSALRRAFDLLNARYPSLWSSRFYEFTWTSGDHSIALPANVMAILNVTWKGVSLRPMTRDDYYRVLRSDEEGGDLGAAGDPNYFRVVGYSDEGTADWRIVMRLHPEPNTASAVVVEYLALAEDYSTETEALTLLPFMQGWCLERAKELWSAENGDSAIQRVAEAERIKHESDIDRWIEGTRPPASRMSWRYPNVVSRRGGRYRGRT